MKHAGPAAIALLEPLLRQVRGLPGLVERRPGIFYRGGRAFLHFHEDPAGLFADARLDGAAFTRFSVSSAAEQARLVAALAAQLAVPNGG